MAFGLTAFAETPFASLTASTAGIIGQQLNTALNTVTVQAGTSVSIETGPEIALDVALGNVLVGLGKTVGIQGQEITSSRR